MSKWKSENTLNENRELELKAEMRSEMNNLKKENRKLKAELKKQQDIIDGESELINAQDALETEIQVGVCQTSPDQNEINPEVPLDPEDPKKDESGSSSDHPQQEATQASHETKSQEVQSRILFTRGIYNTNYLQPGKGYEKEVLSITFEGEEIKQIVQNPKEFTLYKAFESKTQITMKSSGGKISFDIFKQWIVTKVRKQGEVLWEDVKAGKEVLIRSGDSVSLFLGRA